jgi:glutaredoxin 3
MARIEIYTKQRCPYCNRAVRLLQSKGLVFEQYDITEDGPKRDEMIARAKGRLTVPQIFVDGRHIGGSDDLVALEQAGRLDPMLAS